MAFPTNIAEDLKRLCEQMEFDPKLKDYKEQLIDWQKLDNMIALRNQFFYISDFTTGRNIYIHPNIEQITGYPPEEFHNFGRIYELTHPDEQELVLEFSKRTVSFTSLYKKEFLKDPLISLFSIDFRLKHKKGHYINLNRQASCFKTDRYGNMVLAFLIYTDVSHLKKSESFNIFWLGALKYQFYFDDLIKKYQQDYKITKREKDVLVLLANGESATKIARSLGLSPHTIISHRKNLLRKTGTKNTAELVKLAMDKELI
jgi:DNA-binding CsgD family transcriptional regulator